jgi:hypothetical protein
LAIFEIWDELIHALRQAARRLAHERELASRIMPTRGPLWELLKNGVQWSATLDFLSDHQRWEVVITRNRERSQVQQFVTREKADAWADKECVEIAMGWKQ